ncbi:sulfite exporter TauE/SafE family protein [Domibacillus mangrovi]|uniref:Urease accessory protein UreH n=1 Tax=Domibacillus mangrovi TaxID=1714354 RepID=A0A1Q5NZS7_9BACI|nr:sulfite exporter TauE/SafE family protein [Domibacillus mangrovi]OKL35418.1 urease accessory protein UreH [Domibacillus mangrovi]
MDVTLFSILSLGFILGIKHAIEPDHIIAVSTIASRSKKLSQSALAGVFWGIGHTATLFLIGITLILMKNSIPDKVSMSLEFLVGVMLVYLGVANVLAANKNQRHIHRNHSQYGDKHYFIKSSLIGLVHGLAGSAAMVLLTMSTVNSVWQGAEYILIFGAGTVAGMLLFTTVIGIPFVFSSSKKEMNSLFTIISGIISVLFGLYYMYNLAITDGLLSLLLK